MERERFKKEMYRFDVQAASEDWENFVREVSDYRGYLLSKIVSKEFIYVFDKKYDEVCDIGRKHSVFGYDNHSNKEILKSLANCLSSVSTIRFDSEVHWGSIRERWSEINSTTSEVSNFVNEHRVTIGKMYPTQTEDVRDLINSLANNINRIYLFILDNEEMAMASGLHINEN